MDGKIIFNYVYVSHSAMFIIMQFFYYCGLLRLNIVIIVGEDKIGQNGFMH